MLYQKTSQETEMNGRQQVYSKDGPEEDKGEAPFRSLSQLGLEGTKSFHW
jgi:hypothetical protein